MLSKCANPPCSARFHYLHQGRIFKIEMATVLSDRLSSPNHRIELFWLCERCAQTLAVVLENGSVTTRPRRLELSEGQPQEKSDTNRRVA